MSQKKRKQNKKRSVSDDDSDYGVALLLPIAMLTEDYAVTSIMRGRYIDIRKES